MPTENLTKGQLDRLVNASIGIEFGVEGSGTTSVRLRMTSELRESGVAVSELSNETTIRPLTHWIAQRVCAQVEAHLDSLLEKSSD